MTKAIIGAKYNNRNLYTATVDSKETTIYGRDKKEVIAVAKKLVPLIKKQLADGKDQTLAYYACGNDYNAQLEFSQQFGSVTVL